MDGPDTGSGSEVDHLLARTQWRKVTNSESLFFKFAADPDAFSYDFFVSDRFSVWRTSVREKTEVDRLFASSNRGLRLKKNIVLYLMERIDLVGVDGVALNRISPEIRAPTIDEEIEEESEILLHFQAPIPDNQIPFRWVFRCDRMSQRQSRLFLRDHVVEPLLTAVSLLHSFSDHLVQQCMTFQAALRPNATQSTRRKAEQAVVCSNAVEYNFDKYLAQRASAAKIQKVALPGKVPGFDLYLPMTTKVSQAVAGILTQVQPVEVDGSTSVSLLDSTDDSSVERDGSSQKSSGGAIPSLASSSSSEGSVAASGVAGADGSVAESRPRKRKRGEATSLQGSERKMARLRKKKKRKKTPLHSKAFSW